MGSPRCPAFFAMSHCNGTASTEYEAHGQNPCSRTASMVQRDRFPEAQKLLCKQSRKCGCFSGTETEPSAASDLPNENSLPSRRSSRRHGKGGPHLWKETEEDAQNIKKFSKLHPASVIDSVFIEKERLTLPESKGEVVNRCVRPQYFMVSRQDLEAA